MSFLNIECTCNTTDTRLLLSQKLCFTYITSILSEFFLTHLRTDKLDGRLYRTVIITVKNLKIKEKNIDQELLMNDNRIVEHPVLPVEQREEITFYWDGTPYKAKRGEVISSALIANNIRIFGHHHKDESAQGIFCANGQCAKCTVIANGIPVKSCMTKVAENMVVESVNGLPELPEVNEKAVIADVDVCETDVLIIGGGPAGLSAGLEIAKRGISTIIIDDKDVLGGKLVLQTHKFFGSVEDSFAGTRGNDIGKLLAENITSYDNVDVWLESTVLYIFKDKKVGILKDGVYQLVKPKVILNTAGAREKFLQFAGNTLSGIYGAGAFQTLVNRDLVRPTDRLFIVGGGNVGLIAGYHALQADIEVVGLVEALPMCGGYKVHADKLKRLGVPIYTSHTIVSANGEESVDSVTIAQVDENFRVIAGTEKTFKCDTILIAVGLSSVDELSKQAEVAGIKVYSAGDASEIAEASSAMFNGKITGLGIARDLAADVEEIPQSWHDKAEILKSHPGKVVEQEFPKDKEGVIPVIHCIQEIPCNPCSSVCPTNSINIDGETMMGIPKYEGSCIGCGKCVAICPGLAITLVDYRKDSENPIVTVPYEVMNHSVKVDDLVDAVNIDGDDIGKYKVVQIVDYKQNKTQLVKMIATDSIENKADIAKRVVSFKIQAPEVSAPLAEAVLPEYTADDAMVCLCERVTAGEVRKLVREGIHDLNQIKAITRAGMGPCGSKTCDMLVKRIFREEGVTMDDITPNTIRPVFVEVPLGVFAKGKGEE